MPSACRLSMSISRKWARGLHWVLVMATACATDLRVEYTTGFRSTKTILDSMDVSRRVYAFRWKEPMFASNSHVSGQGCSWWSVEAVPLDQVLEVGAEQAMLLEALDRPLAPDLPPRPAKRADVKVSDVQVSEIGRIGGH